MHVALIYTACLQSLNELVCASIFITRRGKILLIILAKLHTEKPMVNYPWVIHLITLAATERHRLVLPQSSHL